MIKSWNVNKSRNNDNAIINKKFTSSQLSQGDRQAFSTLSQLMHSILIFVSVISQQGESSEKMGKNMRHENVSALFLKAFLAYEADRYHLTSLSF